MSTLPIKKPGVPLTTNGNTLGQELKKILTDPQALINDWNAGNKEKFDALMQNEAAAGVLGPGVEKLAAMQTAANQARARGESAAGNYGDRLGRITEGLVEDENGNIDRAGRAGVYLAKNAGDIAGGLVRAGGWAAKADQAANMARTGEMTDAAVADAGAFERGMQGIDMSGIEGSGNMERNLQYGKSRGEAQAEMQYEMMNQEAQGLENSMARSFSELSQGKAGAMQDAWGRSIGQSQADLTALYQDTAAEQMALQPTRADEAALLAEAARAAAGAPNLPGETEGDVNSADPGKTDPASTAQPPAPAALKTADADLYDALEKHLAAGQSYGSLEKIMTGYNLTDAQKAAIQSGTERPGVKTDEWRKEWRDNLWKGLGLQGGRNRGGYR